jgi:hypothetical protein
MTTWGLVVVVVAIAMNAMSGVLWVARPERVVESIPAPLSVGALLAYVGWPY